MNLFKQNHLKLNIKIITAALLLCLGSSLSTSITAADFLEETYEKHCERIRIIYINKDKLKKAEDEFRNTGSNSEKLRIITTPIKLEGITDPRTPLSLAIYQGDVQVVGKFLSVVPDINSECLNVSGYCHDCCTVAKIAIDPHFPYFPANINDRLKIIDLIAEKGGDFSSLTDQNKSMTPPHGLVATVQWQQERTLLRSRALLYGANPFSLGLDYADLVFNSERWNMYNYSKPYIDALYMLIQLEHRRSVKLTDQTKIRFRQEMDKQDGITAELF